MPPSPPLAVDELRAIGLLIGRLRHEVAADLLQVGLFGSRARGDGDTSSDVDILLIFRKLPPGREPHAGIAEGICEEVARGSGVPLTVWSVSLPDLHRGNRTPMLVDALADAHLLWSASPAPLPRVPFTPLDALYCVGSLLDRVGEGSQEFREALEAGQGPAAAKRVRDDLIRLCTGHLLLAGCTRPRRGDAVGAFLDREGPSLAPEHIAILTWARHSYGRTGRNEDAPVRPPAMGFRAAVDVLRHLRESLAQGAGELRRRLRSEGVGVREQTLHSRSFE